MPLQLLLQRLPWCPVFMFRMLEPHSLQSRSAANCPEGSNYSPLKRRVVHGILGIQFLCGKTLHVNNETNSYRISDDSGQSVPATNKLELLITSNEQVARSINTVHKLSRIPGALTSKKALARYLVLLTFRLCTLSTNSP